MDDEEDVEAVLDSVREDLAMAYSDVLAITGASPMQAMESLAAALGSLYQEVADAHIIGQGRDSDWEPDARRDILALGRAFATHAGLERPQALDLLIAIPAGHG